jgi:hypothetical protein
LSWEISVRDTVRHNRTASKQNVPANITPKQAVTIASQWLAGAPELNEYEDYIATPPTACVLNVAGSRESKAPALQHNTAKLVVDVLREVNPECRGLYPLSAEKSP